MAEDATKTTGTPSAEGRRVRFEVCTCGGELGKHGYFYLDGEKCPWATASLETANPLLDNMASDLGLTPEEVTAVRAELSAADLPEKAGEEEKDMLFAFDEAMEERKKLEEMLASLGGGNIIFL